MGDQRIARCLDQNVSVVVGSVDERGDPATCRGLALTSRDDLRTVTVYVPVSTSQQTIANLASTRRMTVVATDPLDNYSVQLKGIAGATRMGREDEEAVARRGFDGFAAALHTIGVPPRVTNAVTVWPALAIDMQVEEIYDQTPGPKAGARLK